MPHLLEQRLAALRNRLWRLTAMYGLSRTAAAVVAAGLALGAIDYLIRFQDRGIRVMASLSLLGVALWAVRRWLGPLFRSRTADVDLALRVERRFPELNENLSAAVEFLRQDDRDPTAGSAALRQAVIDQAVVVSAPLDFHAVIDSRPVRRAARWTAVVLLVAGLFVLADRHVCRIAAARLLFPVGTAQWPRTTHLALRREVRQVARGQTFEVEVIDALGARLPSEVRIHYRFDGPQGKAIEETQRMNFLAGAMTARRENVSRDFSYRVEGGDDQTQPWIDVDVIEPASVESLTAHLTPPDYTGLPPRDSGRQIVAFTGTRAVLSGQANKPLRAAWLCLDDGRRIPAALLDGQRFQIPAEGQAPWILDKSATYWLRLTDQQSNHDQDSDRWEIRAIVDAPPSVLLEEPATNLLVTAAAILPIRVTVKDDLAIHNVDVEVSRCDQPQAPPVRLSLFRGPPRAEPAASAAEQAASGQSRSLAGQYDLLPWKLEPGAEVLLRAKAADYQPATGQSDLRRLTIITTDELLARLASRQNLMLAELARALAMQRDNQSQLQALAATIRGDATAAASSVDPLQAVAMNQRQIERTLTSRGEGVPLHALAILADMKINRVDSPEAIRRIERLLDAVERVKREDLTVIEQELTAAIKALQIGQQEVGQSRAGKAKDAAEPPAESAVDASLAAAATHQQHVVEVLGRLHSQLTQWDAYRRFFREVARLIHEQADLAQQTSSVAQSTLGRPMRDLLPQQQADLKRLATQQFELSLRLDQIQGSMRQAASQLGDADPMAADTLADAVEELQRQAVSAAMQAVGADIDHNRMGQAMEGQRRLLDALQSVLDILSGTRQHELARLLAKLSGVGRQLDALGQRQDAVNRRISEAEKLPKDSRQSSLQATAGQEDEISTAARHLAQQLDRLMAEPIAGTVRRATESMQSAAEAARADELSRAASSAQDAARQIRAAKAEVDQRLRQAEGDLAVEQMSRWQAIAKELHDRQESIRAETARQDGVAASPDRSARQEADVAELAQRQRCLAAEAGQLSTSLGRAQVFALVVAAAGDDMTEAAARLDRRQTGALTQQSQQQAMRHLSIVLESIAAVAHRPERGGDTESAATRQTAGGWRIAAQLYAIQLLQEEVNRRTRQLQESRPGDPEARRQFGELSRQQRELGEAFLQLLESGGEKDQVK